MNNITIDNVHIPVFKQGVTLEGTLDFYKRFASRYDQITLETGYQGPSLAVREILHHFPTRRDIRILDGGAGTGLVGQELGNHDFSHIDAIEPCQEMLTHLKQNNVYRRMICDVLGSNRLPIDDNSYDCLTLIGVIAAGAASHECFPEVIRVVKPGGIIIVTCREDAIQIDPYLNENVEKEMNRLHENGSWRWLKRETVPNYIHEYDGFFAVFEVL